MKRWLAALAASIALIPGTLALASGVGFRTGSYASARAASPRVTFTAGRKKLTKLYVSAVLAECSGPLAATLAHHASAFVTGLRTSIKRDGSFSIAVHVPASVVNGTLSGRLHGNTATGTLSLSRKFDNTPIPSVIGLNSCVTGKLSWSAKRR
jgi:hypothetical protein